MKRLGVLVLMVALVAGGCDGFWGKPDEVPGDGTIAWVEPDRESSTLYLEVVLTDEVLGGCRRLRIIEGIVGVDLASKHPR